MSLGRNAVLVAALLSGVLPSVPAHAAPVCTGSPPATSRITTEPWASKRLAFRTVWPLTRGKGVIVGVVDTGVDAAHPLLAGHVLTGHDAYLGTGPADTDCAGHGTFVAGIVAGQVVDGIGFTGVAPDATILPIRQAPSTLSSSTVEGNVGALANGIRAAVDGGAKVVNVSVVVAQPAPELAAAVRYALERDVVIVAAAGNQAQEGNPAQYPAGFRGVIAVGAIGPDGAITAFSQSAHGVSVVAPGTDIVAPGAGGPGLVAGQQGTSFAAPFVTGVVALVRAYRPHLTVAQVKHRIEATADHPAARSLPDPAHGFGVVNPYRAVVAELPEESGSTAAAPPPARLPVAVAVPATDQGPRRRGLTITAIAAGIGVLVTVMAVVVPSGRRRRWRAPQ